MRFVVRILRRRGGAWFGRPAPRRGAGCCRP